MTRLFIAAFAAALLSTAALGADARAHAAADVTYVSLDSWIYPALDRLAALGLIPSQISGLRPWTRAECRRQLEEAEERLGIVMETSNDVSRLIAALRRELQPPPASHSAVLDSIYQRNGVIAGPVLHDSFHFGQTWSNDFGRPFGRGWNSYEGISARAEAGPVFAYVRGEYQQAPGDPGYPLAVRETIASLDGTPLAPPAPDAATQRFRLLDSYAGVRLGDVAISVGKQSAWWGPTYDAPLSFSNNAEPSKNLKVSLLQPVHLPGLLRYLGQVRGEFLLGKLGGQKYTWRPWFNAQKLVFKLTDNLEMGFTRWSIFWGAGHPMSLASFIRNFTSLTSPAGSAAYGSATDPGDRKGGFDFRYRIPGLRDWLTLYSDSYCEDDPSPLGAPRHAAINPGLYLARVPGAERIDLRIEAPSTRPMTIDRGGDFNYYNQQYRSGNTNYGMLLGNSVGRDGRAVQGWIGLRLSAFSRLEGGFRHATDSPQFLPGGGSQSDASLRATLALGAGWSAVVSGQFERFFIPILGGRQRNLSAIFQFTWEPNLALWGRRP